MIREDNDRIVKSNSIRFKKNINSAIFKDIVEKLPDPSFNYYFASRIGTVE